MTAPQTKTKLSRPRSREIFTRAEKLLVGGVNSPVRAFRHVQTDPLIIDRGEAQYLYDADGNRYLDFVWSWGVIHHSSRTGRVVREIARVCRPGGETRVMVYNRNGAWAYSILLRDHILKRRFLHQTFEEALSLPSKHQYGNGVAIFTQNGRAARDFASRVNVGMVGINVPIPVPVAYHTFGGWNRSAFGDTNQHGMEGVKFWTKVKTVTARWPEGDQADSSFVIPTMS